MKSLILAVLLLAGFAAQADDKLPCPTGTRPPEKQNLNITVTPDGKNASYELVEGKPWNRDMGIRLPFVGVDSCGNRVYRDTDSHSGREIRVNPRTKEATVGTYKGSNMPIGTSRARVIR